MIRFLMFFSLFVFLNVSLASSKVALVIGNSNYTSSPLKNPINDARQLGINFKNLGFEVLAVFDGSQEEMDNAVNSFTRRLSSDKNSIGVFYYSGHGIQHDGANYLIPVGASSLSDPNQLKYKTVSLDYITGSMSQAKNKLNIAIIDACRNSPFKSFTRSTRSGLAYPTDAEGMIIAYSTSPNKTALDGRGTNSPYVESFLRHIKTPNLEIEGLLKKSEVRS